MTTVNPATQPQDQLNKFTENVKWLGSNAVDGELMWHATEWVRLRNGTLVRPVFKAAENDTCEDAFITEDYSYCWNLDGTSVTRSDYDMMEIVYRD